MRFFSFIPRHVTGGGWTLADQGERKSGNLELEPRPNLWFSDWDGPLLVARHCFPDGTRTSQRGAHGVTRPTIKYGSSVGRLETVKDLVPRNRLLFECFLTFDHALAVGRRRIWVAIEDAGIKLGAVVARQLGCARPVGGIVTQRFQTLHVGLVGLELLVFRAVGDAGRLDVDEGKSRKADALFDDLAEASHVRRRALGHIRGSITHDIE